MKHWMHNSIKDALAACPKMDTLDKECILAFILQKNREYIISHPEKYLSLLQKMRYLWLLRKRQNAVPLAYITKHKAFFGLDFLVNKHTLIPRPETEIMVEEVLKHIQQDDTLIDIGVGSGCVPIAIAKTVAKKNKHITLYGTDISSKALKVAKKNTKKHGTSISFYAGNLLQPIIQHVCVPKHSPTFITANLPYITEEQFVQEASIQHEPKNALVAQDNGLALYKELLIQIKDWETKPGDIRFFFEIDPLQSKELSQIIHSSFPNSTVFVKKDLAGHNRLIHGTIEL
ncbi:MAG: protein-(glutamine-N5) methyltransferase, release factor-specific [Candidatus Magasanikbacteria bacterium]|nr:protein-(glutamine-N5) methyltransferase, release factor-specific [Candidatus Magasanikbacteria bacterium]